MSDHKATPRRLPRLTRETSELQWASFTFRAWRAAPRVMPSAHSHTDIELNLLTRGAATYFFAGRFEQADAGRLAVFWGGMPHRLVRLEPNSEYFCMTLPLAWFLSWEIAPLASRFLSGAFVREPSEDEDAALLDRLTFARWASDLAHQGDGPARRAALLEVEARLRRLSVSVTAASAPPAAPVHVTPAQTRHAERIAAFLAQHYREPITVEIVAQAVDLHPNYALATFKDGCGMTLWDYLTRLRVSHAQRLLLTTDWTIPQIAGECGFGSASRFFAVFRRLAGCTPRAYRVGGGTNAP